MLRFYSVPLYTQVAEKASKFKVDTESSGRSKSSQPPSRKTSKEKRPSMCVEMYNSSRIRGSYGNIHNNYHRSHFGANRAVSLDAQCQSRRMSSDGIQSVISDSSVFYHVHSCNNAITNSNNNSSSHHLHFNCNNNNNNNNNHPVTHPHSSCINTHDPEDSSNSPQTNLLILAGDGPPRHPPDESAVAAGEKAGAGSSGGGGSGGVGGGGNIKSSKKSKREFRFRSLRGGSTVASSSSQPQPNPPSASSHLEGPRDKSENNSNVRHFSAANATAATNPSITSGPRSFIARLRQLTGKFTFSFDHHASSSASSHASLTEKASLGAVPQPASTSDPLNTNTAPRKVSAAEEGANGASTALLGTTSKNVNLRNPQADSMKNLNNKMLLSKQLCHLAYVQNKHPLQRSPNASKLKNLDDVGVVCTQPTSATQAALGCVRNRAYSLDVPTKRYSSGSSSRKSSTSNKNDDESFLVPYPNNNNGTCITCSYCSAELVINAETNPGNGSRVRHININVNNLSGAGAGGGGASEGSSGDVAHICDDQCEGTYSQPCRRKASDEDNELSRLLLMNNRMPSNNNFNNSSSSNSNLSKNINI